MSKKRDIATVLLGITVALIIWITILGRDILIDSPVIYRPFHAFISFVKDIRRGRLGVNFLGNVVLFLPLGFLTPIVIENIKWQKVVLTGAVFSLVIEIIQLLTSLGCFDLDDVILNTIGTVLGISLWKAVTQIRHIDVASV